MVFLDQQSRGELPEVCVKTGAPAELSVRVTVTSTAPWTRLVLLFSVIGYLVARSKSQRSAAISLPVTQAAWRRLRRLRWVAATIGLAGAVACVASLATANRVLLVASLVALAVGLVAWVVGERIGWVGLHYRPEDGEVIVTRVHPRFVQAAMDLARARR
ncbi:MAG: hypothetical protein JWM05_2612 [Acidimicrobiales bacterium]|nr:hypothetical protein [Acidimicrobiales bacterium]